MEGLKPPQQWCMDSANLAESWKTWKEEFTLYIEAEEKARVKLFSGLIGERGRELCGTIIDSDTRVTVTSLMAKLDGLCNKVNETVERYRFFERNQAPGESIDKYVTDLRTLANTCNFEQLKDSLIRDRIVCGSHSSSWRERLLREDTLDLDKCLQICRSMEISHVQVKEEPEEQSVKQEEEQLLQVTAVCVKSEEQTEHQEETDSATDGQTDNSSDSDPHSDSDWEPAASTSAAQMETEADGDHDNQVQMKDTRGKRHFMCSVCERTCTRWSSLVAHMKTHKRIHTEERPFSCSVCKRTFTQRGNLDLHMKVHTGKRPYKCTVCKKTFVQKRHLLKHIMYMHKTPNSCGICHKRFGSRTDVERHMVTHAGERPYSCSVCKRTFTHQCYLDKHLKAHAGKTLHTDLSCKVCQKSFSKRGNVERHMLSHTGERPHSCTVCNATFLRKYELNTHMRRHTEGKPYSCSICQKRFVSSTEVKKHKATHTGPYSCSICNATFTQKYNFTVHMRRHTEERPYSY